MIETPQSARADPGPFGLPLGGFFGQNNDSWSQDALPRFRQQFLQPQQIEIMWRIYQRNVAPLIAILHIPTTAQLIQDVSNGLSIDPAREALLLSVTFAAVVSMGPAQCQLELGLEYHSAMRNYESAVHHALGRANLLGSEEIATLQAAVLYLLCARVDGNTRIVWTETAGMFDTEFPINVNGNELEPNMLELPPEKDGFTDITLCIIICFMIAEVQPSPQAWNPVPSLKDREDRIKAVGEILHERYLNHFNLETPIHWVTATIARLCLSKAWASVHSQLSPANLDEAQSEQKDSVFRTAVELVESTYFLQTNHVTTQLARLCRGYKQKEVIAFILSELSVRPPGPETDRAWDAVTKTTSLWRRPSSTGGVPEKPLIELIQRADLLREAKLGRHPPIQMDLSAGDPLGRENVNPDPPLEPWNGNLIPGQISLNSEFSGSYRKPSTLAWLQGIWPYQSINGLL